MSFYFEGDVVLFVEPHDAGVIFKHAHAPVVVTKIGPDLHRGGKDRFLEHVVELASAIFVGVGNPTGQRFVAAVFGPRLSDRFQFNIRRVALECVEMGLNGLHLNQT